MKVRIEDGYVYVGERHVGSIEGRGETWVFAIVNGKREFAARFKYKAADAKPWAKAVFARFSPEVIAKIVAENIVSPADLGNVCGWEMAHIKKWMKEGKTDPKLDAYRALRTEEMRAKLAQAGY